MIIFRSSDVDTKFDETIGHIEDIIMGKFIIFVGLLSP